MPRPPCRVIGIIVSGITTILVAATVVYVAICGRIPPAQPAPPVQATAATAQPSLATKPPPPQPLQPPTPEQTTFFTFRWNQEVTRLVVGILSDPRSRALCAACAKGNCTASTADDFERHEWNATNAEWWRRLAAAIVRGFARYDLGVMCDNYDVLVAAVQQAFNNDYHRFTDYARTQCGINLSYVDRQMETHVSFTKHATLRHFEVAAAATNRCMTHTLRFLFASHAARADANRPRFDTFAERAVRYVIVMAGGQFDSTVKSIFAERQLTRGDGLLRFDNSNENDNQTAAHALSPALPVWWLLYRANQLPGDSTGSFDRQAVAPFHIIDDPRIRKAAAFLQPRMMAEILQRDKHSADCRAIQARSLSEFTAFMHSSCMRDVANDKDIVSVTALVLATNAWWSEANEVWTRAGVRYTVSSSTPSPSPPAPVETVEDLQRIVLSRRRTVHMTACAVSTASVGYVAGVFAMGWAYWCGKRYLCPSWFPKTQ